MQPPPSCLCLRPGKSYQTGDLRNHWNFLGLVTRLFKGNFDLFVLVIYGNLRCWARKSLEFVDVVLLGMEDLPVFVA